MKHLLTFAAAAMTACCGLAAAQQPRGAAHVGFVRHTNHASYAAGHAEYLTGYESGYASPAAVCCEPACGAPSCGEPACGVPDCCDPCSCNSHGCGLGLFAHMGGALKNLFHCRSCSASCCEPTCDSQPSCGCEPTCCAEPVCGTEPTCGSEPSCGCDPCCSRPSLFGWLRRVHQAHVWQGSGCCGGDCGNCGGCGQCGGCGDYGYGTYNPYSPYSVGYPAASNHFIAPPPLPTAPGNAPVPRAKPAPLPPAAEQSETLPLRATRYNAKPATVNPVSHTEPVRKTASVKRAAPAARAENFSTTQSSRRRVSGNVQPVAVQEAAPAPLQQSAAPVTPEMSQVSVTPPISAPQPQATNQGWRPRGAQPAAPAARTATLIQYEAPANPGR